MGPFHQPVDGRAVVPKCEQAHRQKPDRSGPGGPTECRPPPGRAVPPGLQPALTIGGRQMPQHVRQTTVQQQGRGHDAGQCLLEGAGIQVAELEFCQGRCERDPKAHESEDKDSCQMPGQAGSVVPDGLGPRNRRPTGPAAAQPRSGAASSCADGEAQGPRSVCVKGQPVAYPGSIARTDVRDLPKTGRFRLAVPVALGQRIPARGREPHPFPRNRFGPACPQTRVVTVPLSLGPWA